MLHQPESIARNMTCKVRIGEIAIKSEHDVEWKIDKIFSYTVEDAYYYSPYFTLSNCKWYFQIHPNGRKGYAEWIGFYLCCECCSDQGATFFFGIKKNDGEVSKVRSTLSWIFNKEGFGYLDFLKRSELVERKSELAPLDALTMTCTLWKYDNFNSTATGRMRSLSSNLLEMFTSQNACDATLKVKHVKFPVHKVILMAQSSVFAAMFQTPMQEKSTGVVNIKDCDPQAFRDFLVYLYTEKLENLTNHMFELYKIADKYNVRDLKSDCLIALMGNLSVENVTDAVILAEKFGENTLKLKAKEFFNKNCTEIFRSSKWLKFFQKYPDLANGLLVQMSEHMKK